MVKVIGCGAAGCSATITAFEKGVIGQNDFLLLNTTEVDIPEIYYPRMYLINKIINSNSTSKDDKYIERKGTGKERDIAKDICMQYIVQDNGTDFDLINNLSEMFKETINIEEDIVVIVTSTEGGSGSGISVHIASFLKSMGLNVIVCPITGFEKDGRSLKNTFEFFKDMSTDYVIMPLSNKKFLDGGFNYPKAETDCNLEFTSRLRYIIGSNRRRSNCNKEIDTTDQLKAVTTPGIMDIIYVDLTDVKNLKMFNEAVNYALDDTKSIDNSSPQQKKLAIYYNVSEPKRAVIDFNATVIKERLGDVFELFEHIQDPIPSDPIEGKEYMVIISSGMNLPIDEIKATYERFIDRTKSINKTIGGFNVIDTMINNEDTDVFNMGHRKAATPSSINNITNSAKAKFLKQHGENPGEDTKTSGFVNTAKNPDHIKI